MEIIAGLIFGLTGSLHCAGMCGPIVISLPAVVNNKWKFLISRLLYNSGRIITYSLLGLIFGFAGSRIKLSGLQQMLSITTGIIILTGVIFSSGRFLYKIKTPWISQIFLKLKIKFGEFYRNKSTAAFLMTGILNGLLPCGFVYLALSGAVLTGDTYGGMLFMMMFGIGTVPVMMLLSLFGRRLNLNFGLIRKRILPAFTIALAVLFILRGMNLGIPYISPKLDNGKTSGEQIKCN